MESPETPEPVVFESIISSPQSASHFEIDVCEPVKQPKEGALNAPFWSYRINTKTTLPQYSRKDIGVDRRYTDFEWLRGKLLEENPGAIVPPIPEKDFTGTMEKFFNVDSKPLLQYRQRALQLFLRRVAEHPILMTSTTLQRFFELSPDEFRTLRKGSKPQTPSPAKSKKKSSSSGWFPFFKTVPEEAPASIVESVGPGSEDLASLHWIDPMIHYIEKFEDVIKMLKERLSQIVSAQRELGESTRALSDAFSVMKDVERSQEDTQLSAALEDVISRSAEHGDTGIEFATKEQAVVVDMLTYYIGICEAVKQVIAWVQGQAKAIITSEKRLNLLRSDRDKAQSKVPEKVKALEEEIVKEQENLAQLKESLVKAEALFREDWARFIKYKQSDMQALVKAFVEVQIKYFQQAHENWGGLVPSIQSMFGSDSN